LKIEKCTERTAFEGRAGLLLMSSCLALGIVLLIGLGAGAVSAADHTDTQLGQQIKQLNARAQALREEQKRLLLRKMLYSADSKYLELDLHSGEGTLKYRSRILSTFHFWRRGRSPVRSGKEKVVRLSSKNEKPPRLSFDNDVIVLERKGRRRPSSDGLVILLKKRDLAAIQYALETGAVAFVKGP
jgi:hypothetical protein